MNFRSVADLNLCVARNLCNIPRDVDLVVGIPRSGLLAANLVALQLNVPLTDVEGLCHGRVLCSGARLSRSQNIDGVQHVLVIDDSIWGGGAMAAARARIEQLQASFKVTYAAVYSSERERSDVDLIFEHCKCPRIFEWNMMHHSSLERAALDIDGVLCVDPSDEENDDGERYRAFLRTAKALFVPSVPVMALVSSRLSKYRTETEYWLRTHGVQYRSLHLLDLPSKDERIRRQAHGSFKAQILREIDADFFIESNDAQAEEIARRSCRPVISLEKRRLVMPSSVAYAMVRAARVPGRATRFLSGIRSRLFH